MLVQYLMREHRDALLRSRRRSSCTTPRAAGCSTTAWTIVQLAKGVWRHLPAARRRAAVRRRHFARHRQARRAGHGPARHRLGLYHAGAAARAHQHRRGDGRRGRRAARRERGDGAAVAAHAAFPPRKAGVGSPKPPMFPEAEVLSELTCSTAGCMRCSPRWTGCSPARFRSASGRWTTGCCTSGADRPRPPESGQRRPPRTRRGGRPRNNRALRRGA